MFEKSLLIATALLATVSLAGCGSNTPQNTAATPPPAQTQQASSQTTSSISIPTEKAAYIGKVIAVANGEITINKAELPAQRQAAAKSNQGTPQGSQSINPKGDDPGREMRFNSQADTITIPATAQVVMGNDSTIKPSDIKKGQIIRVWEKGGAITFVQVSDINRNEPNNGAQKQRIGG